MTLTSHSKRYIVVDGSESAHCCFEATVVDTSRLTHVNICECFDFEEAVLIAEALNKMEKE